MCNEFVQMIFTARSNLCHHTFSQYVLTIKGWNLQHMIEEVKQSSYRQRFGGFLPLPLGYVHVLNHETFKRFLLLNCFNIFHHISHGAFCPKDVDNSLNGSALLNNIW